MATQYGKTACPQCQYKNVMWRPALICRSLPQWDKVCCANCDHEYNHTEVIDKAEAK